MGALRSPAFTTPQRISAQSQRPRTHRQRRQAGPATRQRICAWAQATHVGGLDDPIELTNGAVTSGPDLSITVDGVRYPNPFVIGSGPPGVHMPAGILRSALRPDAAQRQLICLIVSSSALAMLDVALVHHLPRHCMQLT